MFSFHKPKIYRSNLGCCICKAKSSSSRFTDSKKYENEFERCFRIQEKRSGEICNACVLLVKRWKKLSPENRLIKHWHHVVDARAGPGTKLTGNRRLTNNSPSANNYKTNNNNDLSSSAAAAAAATATTATSNLMSSASGSNQQQNKHHNKQYSNANNRLTDVLPLSSSQANNQATSATVSSAGGEGSSSSSSTSTGTPLNSTGSIRRRTGSWSSNKARAIDTNVSTFTFGEPIFRRSYMASEPSYSTPSSSIYKPQSALNSGAFESVIKRFRQRQQQEQIEAKRRQLNRKQRLMQQQQQQQPQQSFKLGTKTSDATQTAPEKKHQNNYEKQQEDLGVSEKALPVLPSKRLKRSSESIGSLSIDGIRVSTILDNSIWRKEKICCGIIFRGLNNEIAVFPKLLKPCQARIGNKKLKGDQELDIRDDEDLNTRQIQSPPPRATKSGSISSCDSNTSGTGSMEQPLDERPLNKQHRPQITQRQRRKSSLKPLDIPDADMDSSIIIANDLQIGQQQSQPRYRANIVSKRTSSIRAIADNDSTNSSSSSSAFLSSRQSASGANQQVPDSPTASSASSSGASSSRLMLMADDDELIMDEDEEVESNTDSSIESLNEMERKKSNTKTVGALG